jgi:hypothetical protein
VKTFVQEATARLGFLRTEFGFTGPEVVQDETGVYPLLRRIRFDRADLEIEVILVLSYMGEEYVAVHLVAVDESGSNRRAEIGTSHGPHWVPDAARPGSAGRGCSQADERGSLTSVG